MRSPNLYPLSVLQSKESHFIESHFTDIWTDGSSIRGPNPEGGADMKFGCRVVHQLKERNGHYVIKGFMKCLRWYIYARLENYEDITIKGRDMLTYIIYG